MNFDDGSEKELHKSAPSTEFMEAQEKVELRVDSDYETGDANGEQSNEETAQKGTGQIGTGQNTEKSVTGNRDGSSSTEKSGTGRSAQGSRTDQSVEGTGAENDGEARKNSVEEPLTPAAVAGITRSAGLPRARWGALLSLSVVLAWFVGMCLYHFCGPIGKFGVLGLVGVAFLALYAWFNFAIVKVNNYLKARGASVEPSSAIIAAALAPLAIILFFGQFLRVAISLFLELPYIELQGALSVAILAYWAFVQIRWVSRVGWFFRNQKLKQQDALVSKSKKALPLQEGVERLLAQWKVLFITISFLVTIPLFVFTGPVLIYFLNRNIRSIFEVQKGAKAEALPKDKFLIRYRTYAAIELWLRQRFSSKSWKELSHTKVLLALLAAPFLIIGGVVAAIGLLTRISPAIGAAFSAADPGAAASSNITTLVFMACFMFASVGAIMWRLSRQPSHFEFSPAGIRPLRKSAKRVKEGALIEWTAIDQVTLSTGTRVGDSSIVFHLKGGGTQRLKLSSIESLDDREAILKAIELWAPALSRTSEVVQALQPPMDHSYTELWLQALAAPPERDRLKPLTSGLVLKEQRYRVKRSLGVGGQGSAYEAVDQLTDEVVVLKEFLLPVYVDVSVRKEVLESFENEARLLRQLDHRQVVKLVDFFVEDHRAYLVLEHIEGMSLRELVDKHGRLPENRVNELARSMCEILEYLHGREPPVVHRDFTPDNLILRNDGLLKLIDFNVAQELESGATGSVVGKPAYLPPEQFRGTPVTQSDLYSLGATLMFLLMGQDPEPISVSHPREFDQSLSESIDSIVAKATAEEIGKRYRTASQLLSELKPELGHKANLKFVISECTEKIEIKPTGEEGVEPVSSVGPSPSASTAPNTVVGGDAALAGNAAIGQRVAGDAGAAHTDAGTADGIGAPGIAADGSEAVIDAPGRDKPAYQSLFGPKLKRSFSIGDRILQAACYLVLAMGVSALFSPSLLLAFHSNGQYYSHLLAAAEYLQDDKDELAEAECSKAIELRPNEPKGYWMRASSLANEGKNEDESKTDAAKIARRRSDLKKMATLNLTDADMLASIGLAKALKDSELVVSIGQKNLQFGLPAFLCWTAFFTSTRISTWSMPMWRWASQNWLLRRLRSLSTNCHFMTRFPQLTGGSALFFTNSAISTVMQNAL
jgi:Serine/threonine protein kinase